MEFTQQLDAYEHAQCVEAFKWKCLICSVEARDQVGWKCSISVMGLFTLMESMVLGGCAATNARKLINWTVTSEKEENIKFPFHCTFNECRK